MKNLKEVDIQAMTPVEMESYCGGFIETIVVAVCSVCLSVLTVGTGAAVIVNRGSESNNKPLMISQQKNKAFMDYFPI